MTIIFAIISALAGLVCIDYNTEHEVKHNLILGITGYVLTVIIPLALIMPNL